MPLQPNQVMNTLTNQYYLATCHGLGLSEESFQLFQGAGSYYTLTPEMWTTFNAIPPKAINNFYDPARTSQFSSMYGLLLGSLVSNPDPDFKICMGDSLSDWQTYLAANLPDPVDANSLTKLFKKWCTIYDTSRSACALALTKEYVNPINTAAAAYEDANGQFAFDRTLDDLRKEINRGTTGKVNFSTKTQSSNISETWAKVDAEVGWSLFSAKVDAEYNRLSAQAYESGIDIEINYKKYKTFSAGPLSQPSTDSFLKSYNPWYVSSVVSLAQSDRSNKIWNPDKPQNWDTFFNPETGKMLRTVSAVVVADGIDITITSKASYSKTDQELIKAGASVGYWPFFSADGSGGTKNVAKFDENGVMTVKISNPEGNPQVIGVIVSPL